MIHGAGLVLGDDKEVNSNQIKKSKEGDKRRAAGEKNLLQGREPANVLN